MEFGSTSASVFMRRSSCGVSVMPSTVSTMPAVRVMPTPMAELVMVLMILGRMMSHRVVIAAQNRSMNRVFLYFAR